jgi:hypothetical protein
LNHALFHLMPACIAGIWFLLSQTVSVDPGILSVVSLVANGGTVTVLVWYVVYDVRVRTPNMVAAFAAEQKSTREAFAAAQSEFSKEQAATRAAFLNEQSATRMTFAAQHEATVQRHDRDVAEWRKMLFDNMAAMRSAVHDVKDTAQAVLNSKALSDARAT